MLYAPIQSLDVTTYVSVNVRFIIISVTKYTSVAGSYTETVIVINYFDEQRKKVHLYHSS